MEIVNELNLIKEITNGIAGASIWIMCLYVAAKALSYAVVIYLIKKVYDAVIRIFCCDVSKHEYTDIQDEIIRVKRDCEQKVFEYKKESDEVKHMYKILKEAKEAKNE